MTRLLVSVSSSEKRFDEFQNGEMLVSITSHNLGMKQNNSRGFPAILWFDSELGMWKCSTDTVNLTIKYYPVKTIRVEV